jgi:FkbM family methyltransferase
MLLNKDIRSSIKTSIRRNGRFQTFLIIIRYILLKMQAKECASFKVPMVKENIFLRPGNSDFSVFRQIFMNGEYDIDLPLKPVIIIDAGANIGLAAIYFSNRFPKAQLYCIEPDPGNFSVLQKQTAHRENINLFMKALWHSNEVVSLQKENVDSWGIKVNQANELMESQAEGITLQTFMDINSIEIVDLLKIDIEGAEVNIFSEGYEFWLKRTRILIIELHENLHSGTEKIFYNAINCIKHKVYRSGENVVMINLELL